jgi:hypothetical protein
MMRFLRRMRRRPIAVTLALAALIVLVVFGVLAPKAAAGGWLTAFVFWSGVPVGCLTALLIHALTGGRWGDFCTPLLWRGASALPLMAILFVPVLVALPGFYVWASPGSGVERDVAHYYLNAPFFVARTVLAFAGWLLLAWLLPRLTGAAAALTAALGLIFHGFIIGFVGLDWVLSLQPLFHSPSFGADLAFLQLASAFAWTAIVLPANAPLQVRKDIAGLLLATLLGIAYINFMAVLVIWYGDLPARVFWFVDRGGPWTLIAWLTFFCGSVIPIFALFLGRVRASAAALRIVSIVALAGIALFGAYLIAPPFGLLALAAAGIAIVAMGTLLAVFLATPLARINVRRWRSAHAA